MLRFLKRAGFDFVFFLYLKSKQMTACPRSAMIP
jgi:hypothetical protein